MAFVVAVQVDEGFARLRKKGREASGRVSLRQEGNEGNYRK